MLRQKGEERQKLKERVDQYRAKDKDVKTSCKQGKRNYVEHLAKEAESACGNSL